MPLNGRLPAPPALRSLQQLFAGSFWLVLAGALGQGSMLLSNLLVANFLGVEGYGRYAMLQTTIQVLAGLAQVSLTVVIAQQVASSRSRDPDFAGQIATFGFLLVFALSSLFAGAMILGRHLIAEYLFRDQLLIPGLVLAAVALPWVAAAAVQQGVFSGLERFRTQAFIAIALVPVVIAAPALGAWQAGLMGALVGVAGTYLLRFMVPQFMIARIFRDLGLRWKLGSIRPKMRLLFRYALPATISGILNSLAIWGGQTLLIRSEGGAATVGLFAAAFMVKTLVMFTPAQMAIALLPMLSRFYTDGTGNPRRLLMASIAGGTAVTVALAAITIAFAPEILGLFGPDFATGRMALVFLILATPLEALTLSLTMRFQATTRFWRALLVTNVPLALTVVSLAAALVPDLHAEGLALAWLAAWAVACLTTVIGSGGALRRSQAPAEAPV